MNVSLLVFIGIMLGIFNSIALKYTIKIFLNLKSLSIIFISFFIRIFIVCLVFYIFLNNSWKNAALMLLGLTISKIFFIIYEKAKKVEK